MAHQLLDQVGTDPLLAAVDALLHYLVSLEGLTAVPHLVQDFKVSYSLPMAAPMLVSSSARTQEEVKEMSNLSL